MRSANRSALAELGVVRCKERALMNELIKIFAEPESRKLPPVIPTSEWTSHFCALVAAKIADSGVADLREMTAFIRKPDNRPGLCGGRDCQLPDLSADPDVLVYCYVKNVSAFTSHAAMIERLLELGRERVQVYAKYGIEGDDLTGVADIVNSTLVDQIAFGIACELDEQIQHL